MLCADLFAISQDELEGISASRLLTKAESLMGDQRFAEAIPYLEHYLDRMAEIEDERVVAMRQAVRLKLGRVYAYTGNMFDASERLKEYTETLPLYRPREAWKLLALTYYKSGQFEVCVDAAETALSNPLPKGLDTEEKETDYDELSKDEMAGFSARQMKRIAEYAEGAEEEDAISGKIDATADAEPDYTLQDLVLLNMTLAEANTELENWEATIEPYKFVIENAIASDRKGQAIMKLVSSLISLGRLDDANNFIVELYYTDARYDIRVNMALMNAAWVMYNAKEYDSSLMLFRMILPRADLVEYQVDKMNNIRREEGLPRVALQLTTNDLGQVNTVFGSISEGVSKAEEAFSTIGLPDKPQELLDLEESVRVLIGLTPYEDDVLYRTGLLYARSGRPWEAVAALEYIVSLDPDSDRGQDAFAENLMVLTDPLEKYGLVDERGKQFLNVYSGGRGPRRVLYALSLAYQKQERWGDIKGLLPILKELDPSDDENIIKYECELYYMQAVADLVLANYEEAKAGFERVLNEYPDSHQQESSTYWHAMVQLFLKNYQEALDEYSAYADAWPDGNWVPSAAFHSGVCLFSLEDDVAARMRFTEVIKTWPDHSVYSDARSMRADLLASEGYLDAAQADYEEAIASAHQPRQATYAVFKMAAMFELEDRYEEILNVVNAYLDSYGDKADVAKAAFWIGKTKLAQGLTGEAIDAYLKTIVQFGDDVSQDGVDLIISELLTLYTRLSDEEQDKVQAALQTALQEADNVTLQLRLRVMLAEMDGTSYELGRQLNADLVDLTQAPPPVLGVICNSAFKVKDYSRAAEILNLFQIRYQESEFMKVAMKLRGFELFETQQYDAAMTIAKDAQDFYGGDIEVVWAQIMMGRIFLEKGDFASARELFRETLTMSQWRGEAFAEATYYLGQVEEADGNFREAFAWYQRTYFQYKGFAGGMWAAEGYLASARCLKELGLETEMTNTYRAMLFDKYVNKLPQADIAREALGAEVVREISMMVVEGIQTNITVKITGGAAE